MAVRIVKVSALEVPIGFPSGKFALDAGRLSESHAVRERRQSYL